MSNAYTPTREALEILLNTPLKRTLRDRDLRLLYSAIGNDSLTYQLLLSFRRPQYTRPSDEWMRDMRRYTELWLPELPSGRCIQLRARLYSIAAYFPNAIRVPSYIPCSVLDLFWFEDLPIRTAQELLNIVELEKLANFPAFRHEPLE